MAKGRAPTQPSEGGTTQTESAWHRQQGPPNDTSKARMRPTAFLQGGKKFKSMQNTRARHVQIVMVAMFCSHFGPPFNATLGFPGEGWRKGHARAGTAPDLVIRTHNVSGWPTATEALRTAPTETQIMLLQEVRTRPDQVQARRMQAQQLGWQLHIEPSRPTEAGGWSAGVATAHRPNLRLMGTQPNLARYRSQTCTRTSTRPTTRSTASWPAYGTGSVVAWEGPSSEAILTCSRHRSEGGPKPSRRPS